MTTTTYDFEMAPGNDWEFDYAIKRKNALTRILEGATGLTGLQGWFSLTDAGPAISGTATSLGEASPTLAPGRYFGVLDRTPQTAALTPSIGQVLYEVIDDGANVLSSRPFLVVAARRPN